jgi:multiple sugar transport system permease protein
MMKGGTMRKNISKGLNKQRYGYYFVLPALILFGMFVLWPFLQAIIISFYKYNIGVREFIGFDNYIKMFHDPVFMKTLINNVLYIVIVVPCSLFLSLGISLAIYRKGTMVKSVVRAIFYLPAIVPSVCMAVVWKWLYNPEYGLLNIVIKALGGPEVRFLGDQNIAIFAVMLIIVMWTIGQPIILFTASLGNVPSSVLEAADIDGASGWQKFWRVTWPMIKPTTLYIMVTLTIGVMQVIEAIMLTTNGGPYYASNSLLLMIYNQAFDLSNFGYASAIGNIMFVIVAILSVIQFKVMNTENN